MACTLYTMFDRLIAYFSCNYLTSHLHVLPQTTCHCVPSNQNTRASVFCFKEWCCYFWYNYFLFYHSFSMPESSWLPLVRCMLQRDQNPSIAIGYFQSIKGFKAGYESVIFMHGNSTLVSQWRIDVGTPYINDAG